MVFLAIYLAIVTFLLNYLLELHFYRAKVFDQYNVLYNSDPNRQLKYLSQEWGGTSIAHPNLLNFFSPPIKFLAKLIQWSGISRLPEITIRRSIALLLVPICSGVKIFFICLIFYYLGFSVFQTCLIALLSIVSFSQLIFGSTPDHFALSSLGIVILYFLLIILLRNQGRFQIGLWLIVGVFITGITITNMFVFGLLLFAALYFLNRKFFNAMMKSLLVVLLVIIVNVSLLFTMHHFLNIRILSKASTFIQKYMIEHPLEKVQDSPIAIANTVAPCRLNTGDIEIGSQPNPKFDFMITFQGTPGLFSFKNILGLAIIILTVLGTIKLLLTDNSLRLLAILSIMVIVFNLIFHAIWGDEYFLYSQHWYFSVILLLSGVMFINKRLGPVVNGGFLLFTVWVVMNNFCRIRELLKLLQ